MGLPGASVEAECDCQKAPSFNVLACARQRVGGVERALTPAEVTALGCRPDDRIDKGLVAQDGAPPEFIAGGQPQLASASKAHAIKVTGGWDAAQSCGYDATSRQRVKRDPADPAKLLLRPGPHGGAGELLGQLPMFGPGAPISPQWAGQEATAFPDNWRIGLSLHHTLFCARTQRRRQRLSGPGEGHPRGRFGLAQPGACGRGDPRSGRERRLAVRGYAPRHRGRDREDPHQRLGQLSLQNAPQVPAAPHVAEPELGHPAGRRSGARPAARPRTRRAALQRIPPPVRTAPAPQLRRFHRRPPARLPA